MSELRDLYQEVILDHSRQPRNFYAMEDSSHRAEGYNPLCGDKVTIYLRCEDDVVTKVSFEGAGCAISTASASILTECLVGKTRQAVQELFDSFHDMLTGKAEPLPDTEKLGKLAVFQGVCEFPMRVKCATLAWHALQAAFDETNDSITTE